MGRHTINSILPIYVFWIYCMIPANGSCNMMNRIKNRDDGMNVTATETPCEMVVRSNDHRQVVAVIYNYGRNCIGSGVMRISDGNQQNNTVINNACRATNISFASRRNGLIITLTSPYQPFDIDLYLIDTVLMYTAQTGRIVSPQFPGSDGGYTHTTPNNYHGVYQIVSAYSVSMYLVFTEFGVQLSPSGFTPTCTRDVVKILRDHILFGENCGDGFLPPPALVLAKQLTLEYITDNLITFTGFSAIYMICTQEVNLTKPTGSIDFGLFPSVDRTCTFTVRLEQRERIQLNLQLELSSTRNCSQYLTIFRDNAKFEHSNCDGVNSIYEKEIRFEFNLKSGEILEGNYSIDIQNIEQDEVTPTRTTTACTNSDSAMAIGIALSVMGVVVTLCNITIYVYRRKQSTSKPRQNTPGSHTTRDNLNLNAVQRSDYESPIVPTSEINYSVPVEVRRNTRPGEDEYVNMSSTEHQRDNLTDSNQQGQVYESAVIESNIYEHKYSTLNS